MGAKIKINSNSSEVLESRGRVVFFLSCVRRRRNCCESRKLLWCVRFFCSKGLAGWLPALEQARRLIYCPTRKLIYLNF
jgi:hypothetical protein